MRPRAYFEKFCVREDGTVVPAFGLMALVMFVTVGGAIDFGRWLHARNETIRAMDAAVLAGGRMLQITGMDESEALSAAERFYAENTQNRPPLSLDSIGFKLVDNGTAITATGTASLDTTFLRLVGIEEMPLVKASAAEHSKAVLAVGGNAESNVEISLMLDISGSMSGSKFTDMKAAATDLVNIVVWDDQSKYTSKISIVPFSSEVRLPPEMRSKVNGPGPFNNVSLGGRTYRPSPCAVKRHGEEKFTDSSPGLGKYVTVNYTTSGSCNQPENAELLPLTNNKNKLLKKISDLTLGGGTSGHLGTAWAWYTLSPNWADVFDGTSKPASYSTMSQKGKHGQPLLRKIAILMTDGEYNRQYTINGISGTSPNGSSNTQARALCDGMKAAGITVYTVGFDLGGNQTAIDTLKLCASDETTFYNTGSGEELRQAFRDIALKISSLYLSQ